jgi:ABC-2 type transport system ATP-binding protein
MADMSVPRASPSGPFALRATGLVKRYGDLVAVDGIDLAVRAGTCLGLLGPNGAGKTTTIEMLEGLKTADAGEIEILGRRWRDAAHEIRERIGVQLQETKLEEKITVREAVALFASFYRRRRVPDEVLAEVGLEEKRDARYETLSGGQKQRLALACALVNRPELLFLDEPTTGLDPQARRRVWEIVEDFVARGGTVVLTTHYMEEAERLSDDVVIVDSGRVIEAGSPRDVVARLGAEAIVELHFGDEADRLADFDEARVLAMPGVRSVRREPGVLVLSTTAVQQSVGALLGWLGERGIALEDLRTHRPTLEDVFVALTGKHLRDA